jgi:hypothetical protein
MPKYESSVFRSEFKSCNFTKDLSVILEKTDDIDLDSLKKFLDNENNIESTFQFGSCIQFLFKEKEILLRGYKLSNCWLASEVSPNVHKIPIWGSIEEVIITLYYYYHMSTCV